MADSESDRRCVSGRYSPLRYPGGKGKLAKFVKSVIHLNGLSDGHYVEPYAGGAAIAWELLLRGIVRRVTINDISRPIFAFWDSVLNETDALCERIERTPVTLKTWDRCKAIFLNADEESNLEVGFAFFFLNRTNRSGIINAGVIGGRDQTGNWKIDARYNKAALIDRIRRIASRRSRITVCHEDAVEFLESRQDQWGKKTLIYVDPPYFEKGRQLYYDFYEAGDHASIASVVQSLKDTNWIVSYDDVRPIHDLYESAEWMQYTINYSARNKLRGREAMFFSENLIVPEVQAPMEELDRGAGLSGRRPVAVSKRDIPDVLP